ncbi:LemA family protein [Marinobacter oulmenensis]|uniref:LemA protein n=1 Tax=Marinobacter oulmenensis TaxID=643747 RepID=A0A840UKN7_9GAMM|nr:LemA family protein [Marinobacter oulmenensis]MBB5321298.1 LemA protein [Marinobacter oulmenensis]
MVSTIIGLLVIAVVIGYLIAIYNRLVSLRNQFKNGFAQIDVQLQRRHDLVPNLVESAKAYLEHEKSTLTQVMEARNNAVNAQKDAASDPADGNKIQRLGSAENLLTKALANFNAVVEDYPELKADQTIQDLMEELSTTENRVAFARQAYNDTVMSYNIYRESFPNNILAGLFAFRPTAQLQLESPEARQAPKVSF